MKRSTCWTALVGIAVAALLLMAPAWAVIISSADDDAPQPHSAPPIRLRSGVFYPARDAGLSGGDAVATPERRVGERAQYIVQFEGPVLAEWREALVASGATILDYLPDYAYHVEMTAAIAQDVAEWPDVIWVGPYAPAFSVAPQLWGRERGLVRIELASVMAAASAADLIRAHDGWVVGREGTTMVARVGADALAVLSRSGWVRWIDRLSIPRLHNDVAVGEIGAGSAWGTGLTGAGQMVNVADTGLDTGEDYPQVIGDIHRDIDNRIVHIRSWPISSIYHGLLVNPLDNDGASDEWSGHGTHVAGSVLGNGYESNGQYRGVAYQAGLTFQALEQYGAFNAAGWAEGYSDGYWMLGIPSNLEDLYNEAYRWGSRIHTNSWGMDVTSAGQYDILAQQTDRYVWEHRNMTIVFSVGNEARDVDGDGRVDMGSIVSPATAKNIIAVGATENRRPNLATMWPYQTYGQFFGDAFGVAPITGDGMSDAGIDGMMAASGRGPTQDGRIAPHVVAPGTWIASLRSSKALQPGWDAYPNIYPHYVYLGGTSMSAPIVAGSVALVRQAYLARGHHPSAALLKAMLIQTATDIPGQYASPYNDAGPIPNDAEGWGAIDVASAVLPGRRFIDETRSLQTGDVAVDAYASGAPSASRPAKFTLVWTDHAAAPEAGVDLVNDLDLVVTAPGGEVYYGNVFAGGVSRFGGAADRRNNVECVYLPSGPAGTYTVTVRAYNVPLGPQSYALLVDVPPQLPQEQRLALPLVFRAHHVVAPPTATATPTQSAPGTIPAPTATPTQTVTCTVTPMVSATPTLLPGEFRDDFATPSDTWTTEATTEYKLEYLAGEYRILVYPDRARVGSLPAIEQGGDLTLEVDGRAANYALQAYGLLFNHRELPGGSDYYTFVVAPSGYYAVARIVNGQETQVVGWTASDAIALDLATNRLSVRCQGQQVTCAVNGQIVMTLSGTEYTGGNRFGVVALRYGDPYADARFDNLRMVPGSSVSQQSHVAVGPLLEVSTIAGDPMTAFGVDGSLLAPARPRQRAE